MNETEDPIGSVSTMQEREQAEQISHILEWDYRRYPHPVSEKELT